MEYLVSKLAEVGSRQLLLIRDRVNPELYVSVYDSHSDSTLMRMCPCNKENLLRGLALLDAIIP